MSIWKPDLTTEDGALGAAQLGGYACYVAAALAGLNLFWLIGAALTSALGMVVTILVLVQMGLFAFTGFRMSSGKGAILGIIVALLLLFNLLNALAPLNVGGLIVNVILLAAMFNGIRGAFAVRANKFGSADEAAEIFR